PGSRGTGSRRRAAAVSSRRSVLVQFDLVALDQGVGEELLAHPLDRSPRSSLIALVELQVDNTADPCVPDREAELSQRAFHGLALRVENALLRSDEHRGSHRRTISGSAR